MCAIGSLCEEFRCSCAAIPEVEGGNERGREEVIAQDFVTSRNEAESSWRVRKRPVDLQRISWQGSDPALVILKKWVGVIEFGYGTSGGGNGLCCGVGACVVLVADTQSNVFEDGVIRSRKRAGWKSQCRWFATALWASPEEGGSRDIRDEKEDEECRED